MKTKLINENDFCGGQYSPNSNIRPHLCDYSDVYIVLKGKITFADTDINHQINKEVAFTNNAPFRLSISKIINAFIDNSEDLDIAMPMYNLLECSDNYSMTQEACGSIIEMK